MSRDLIVVTHERPGVPASEGWESDGPAHVEAEDLPDRLAAAVLAPRWQIEFHVSHSAPKASWTQLVRAARGIAEAFHGAVYDPQEDAVLWPRAARRLVLPATDERIRVVRLDWFSSRSRYTPGSAAQFLEVVTRHLPEARPTRMGTYEPLQVRLEPGNDAPFLALAAEQTAVPFGDGLLLRCGAAPLDASQLGGVFPALPERLVARDSFAEFIPALD